MLYILDGERAQIGPFKNREKAERFIKMMALCGEDWADNTIVERGGDAAAGQNPAPIAPYANQLKSANVLKLVRRRP